MPTFRVTAPDGTSYDVTGPDGSTADQALAQVQAVHGAPQQAAPSGAQAAGGALRDIPRQVGLAARYGIEGLGQAANVITEPIRAIINPLARLAGWDGVKSSTGEQAGALADAVGLPQPQNANERVIGDASRMVASAGGMAGAAGAAAARAAPGIANNVLAALAAKPAVQAAGAATSGLAGGSVREAGGSPLEQFGASLLGGVAGGAAASKAGDLAGSASNAIKAYLTPKPVQMQRADQQITLALQQSGIDWSAVPERIRQSMREEVSAALTGGQPLNPDAVRRLLVFKRANVTPTVGMLTQDPGTITREQNLAKAGANSTDPALQRLPGLQSDNTRSLLQQLDDSGAANAATAPDTARKAIESLDSTAARSGAQVDALYKAARDSQGRSAVLNGPAAMEAANQRLMQDNVGKLPPEVDQWMNAITKGETPLTVDYQQQLVKNLYRKMQGAGDNGDLRHGLRIVREALDNADPLPAPQVNPGNLPAVAGTVPASPAVAGQESIDAYLAARNARRQWTGKVEANPALKAVVDGAEPDQFVQKFVIGKGATAADVQALKNELTPEANQAMRDYLVKHLKDAATNNTEDINKFSGAAYRKALDNLGEKLPAFFTKDEIQHLRDLGDAAKYMQAQPAGSAVNNSNSGALILGKGLDMLASASKVPLNIAKSVLSGTMQGYQQSQALAPRNALAALAPPQKTQIPLNPLLAIAAEDRRKNASGN